MCSPSWRSRVSSGQSYTQPIRSNVSIRRLSDAGLLGLAAWHWQVGSQPGDQLSLCALYSKPLEDRCLIIIDTEGGPAPVSVAYFASRGPRGAAIMVNHPSNSCCSVDTGPVGCLDQSRKRFFGGAIVRRTHRNCNQIEKVPKVFRSAFTRWSYRLFADRTTTLATKKLRTLSKRLFGGTALIKRSNLARPATSTD
jgi:hypothetical protein